MLEGIKGVSSYSGEVDNAFIIVTVITLFLFVVTIGSMLYFAFKYKASKNPPEATKNIKHYTPIEVAWTVIPTILMMIVFYYGLESLRVQRTMPNDKDAIVVKVLAQRWFWQFEYENGKKSSELTVPINTNIKLKMTSASDDVLHSFFVPAFRAKEDVIPNKETLLWFSANELGKYDILCAEYCGTRHSYMTSFVNVVSNEDFTNFLNPKEDEKASIKDPIAVLNNNGCIACHSLDGSKLIGPSFKNKNKEVIVLEDGIEKTILRDRQYLKNSILKPNMQIVKDYPSIMPSFENRISNDDLELIISYLNGEEIVQKEVPKKIDAFELIQNNGCLGCHSLDGSEIVGPSFKDSFAKQRVILVNGEEKTITIDENYLKTSILNPKKELAKGYGNIMPSFEGILSEEEVDAIILYLKELR